MASLSQILDQTIPYVINKIFIDFLTDVGCVRECNFMLSDIMTFCDIHFILRLELKFCEMSTQKSLGTMMYVL